MAITELKEADNPSVVAITEDGSAVINKGRYFSEVSFFKNRNKKKRKEKKHNKKSRSLLLEAAPQGKGDLQKGTTNFTFVNSNLKANQRQLLART
jgi:hypothetical protein